MAARTPASSNGQTLAAEVKSHRRVASHAVISGTRLFFDDENGLALRGVLLRHLVMPGGIAGTRGIREWVARELSPGTFVNLMAQYRLDGKVSRKEYVEIDRCISDNEFQEAIEDARTAELTNVWAGNRDVV
ncbi:MAG: hypothetical protein ABSF92_07370 [Candidatus Acidiferrales bacterium]